MNALIPLGIFAIVALLCVVMCCFRKREIVRRPENTELIQEVQMHEIPGPLDQKQLPVNINFNQDSFPSVTDYISNPSQYEMTEDSPTGCFEPT